MSREDELIAQFSDITGADAAEVCRYQSLRSPGCPNIHRLGGT